MSNLPSACLPSGCFDCVYDHRPSPAQSHAWVGGRGDPATARLLIVGEAPGEEERWQGKPFVGPSGKQLTSALGEDYESTTYITNSRKCLPPEVESPANLKSSLLHCGSTWLRDELAACREARTILCVGADALWQIAGVRGVSECVGAVWNRQEVEAIRRATRPDFPLELPPRVHSVVACLHPAAAMRGARWMLPTLRAIMARAQKWSKYDWGPRQQHGALAGLSINLNPTPEELTKALEEADGPVAVDVETPTGSQADIILCGVAPRNTQTLVCTWREPFISLIEGWLKNSNHVACGHNFYYDYGSFYANAIEPHAKVYDTITIGSCLWPPVASRKAGETGRKSVKVPWLGLQPSVLRCLDGVAPWKGLEQPWMQAYYEAAFGDKFGEWEWPKLYCALDCIYTRQLLEAERKMMEGL